MEKPTIFDKLFPTPVMFGHLEQGFTKTELEFINNLEMRENYNNSVSTDTYVLKSSELSEIRLFIEEKINFYFQEIYKPTKELNIYITQSWLNYTETNQYHHKHEQKLI